MSLIYKTSEVEQQIGFNKDEIHLLLLRPNKIFIEPFYFTKESENIHTYIKSISFNFFLQCGYAIDIIHPCTFGITFKLFFHSP